MALTMTGAAVLRATVRATILTAIGALCVGVGGLVAQGALAQLGLTEAAARSFVLDEIKSPAADRRSAIVLTGTRAFLKLPPSARGAAATALFAWAKAYVNSPAFKASYTSSRNDRIPPPRQYPLTVEEAVKKEIDAQLAGMEQMKQGIASMSPADQARILASIKQQQAYLTNPETIKTMRAMLEAERAQEGAGNAALIASVEEETPADPQKLFARRLREFLDATADVNFSARTIKLTGGPDGIEFVDRADRKRSWLWHEAVIVGPETTAAARASAQAWLKEIER